MWGIIEQMRHNISNFGRIVWYPIRWIFEYSILILPLLRYLIVEIVSNFYMHLSHTFNKKFLKCYHALDLLWFFRITQMSWNIHYTYFANLNFDNSRYERIFKRDFLSTTLIWNWHTFWASLWILWSEIIVNVSAIKILKCLTSV